VAAAACSGSRRAMHLRNSRGGMANRRSKVVLPKRQNHQQRAPTVPPPPGSTAGAGPGAGCAPLGVANVDAGVGMCADAGPKTGIQVPLEEG
jgi:hypothetical protein